MRRPALFLLTVAILLGAYLRLSDLGRLEMSEDEGASWAAAAAPSLSQVIELQARLNLGKMAVHEVILHEWIQLFGDSIVAQRMLSALLGTISILLVYWVAWELIRTDHGGGEAAVQEAQRVAGLGALI